MTTPRSAAGTFDDRDCQVTLTIPMARLEAFNAMVDEFRTGESKWDVVQTIEQRADEDRQTRGVESLKRLFAFAEQHSTGGSRVIASVLASLYNGHRFQVDLTDLRLLDSQFHQDVLNVLALDKVPEQEVHCYFDKGGRRFEALFERYGLPDRGKASSHVAALERFEGDTILEALRANPKVAERLSYAMQLTDAQWIRPRR